VKGYFFLYGVSRGSFLLGTNNRTSTLTTTVAGSSLGTTNLTENKTNFIPIGEFEAGLAWGKPLAIGRADVLGTVNSGPLLWLKAGMVADIWGGLGLLSPQDGVQGFSTTRMFLFGFSVLAGVQF
jgi:hypothetical protein